LAPQAIFAGVVAAFTIKLVQITRDLWVVTKESADAARKAADAADLSAHAALNGIAHCPCYQTSGSAHAR
jgi:hypothetical protein